tara:strand:- start:521 stop:1156 length:636 start_codon:yes stop_codon:yes gene_type:complete
MTFSSVYEMTNPLTVVRKQHFWDWFSGDSLNARWTQTQVDVPASFTMMDGVDEGFKITADGGANNEGMINFNNTRQYEETGSVSIGVVKATDIVSVNSYSGMSGHITGVSAGNGYLVDSSLLWVNSNNTNFALITGHATVSNSTEGSVALNTNWQSIKIENGASDTKLSINGVLDVTKDSTYKPTIPMQPVTGAFGNGKSIQVRYCEAYNT